MADISATHSSEKLTNLITDSSGDPEREIFSNTKQL